MHIEDRSRPEILSESGRLRRYESLDRSGRCPARLRKDQMSRLLDRLERINRGVVSSMGFGAQARVERLPSMALIGLLSEPSKALKAATTLAKIGADAALVAATGPEQDIGSLAEKLESLPWGLRVEEFKGGQSAEYKEKGCDFLAFQPDTAHLSALEDEDTGYVLCIQPDMDERDLRVIEDLPVDAVLLNFSSAKSPLTIQHLITIGSVRGAFSKYLLLEIAGVPAAEELEGLRDIGVDGLVVDATAVSAKELEALKEGLLGLPKRQRDRSRKAFALLPTMTPLPEAAASEDDDYDDI